MHVTAKWRVQASWTVGDVPHSYQPVWCDSEDEAERVRAEMTNTLSHFPALQVDVAQERFEPSTVIGHSEVQLPTVHAMGKDGQPICDASVDKANACVAAAWFDDVESARRCADCLALL